MIKIDTEINKKTQFKLWNFTSKKTYAYILCLIGIVYGTLLSCEHTTDALSQNHTPTITETTFHVNNQAHVSNKEDIYSHSSPKRVKIITYSQTQQSRTQRIHNHCHEEKESTCSLFLVMTPSAFGQDYSNTHQSRNQQYNHNQIQHAHNTHSHTHTHEDIHNNQYMPFVPEEDIATDVLIQPSLTLLNAKYDSTHVAMSQLAPPPAEYYRNSVSYTPQSDQDMSIQLDTLSTEQFIDHTSSSPLTHTTKLFAKQKAIIAEKEIRTLVWWNIQSRNGTAITDPDVIAKYDHVFENLAQALIAPAHGTAIYRLLFDLIDEHLWTPKSPSLVPSDESINIVFMPLKNNILGFVNSRTFYASSGLDKELNEKNGLNIYLSTRLIDEIIYAHDTDVTYATNMLYQTLVHELQHISTFNQKTFKVQKNPSYYPLRWLNELASIATEFLFAVPIARLALLPKTNVDTKEIYHLVERYYSQTGMLSQQSLQEQVEMLPSSQVNSRHYKNWRLFANYLMQRYPYEFLSEFIRNTHRNSESLVAASKKFEFPVNDIDELLHEYGVSRIIPSDFMTKGPYQNALGTPDSFSGYYITNPQSIYTTQTQRIGSNGLYYYCPQKEEISGKELITFFPRVLDKANPDSYTYLTPVLHNHPNCRTTSLFERQKKFFTPLWNSIVDTGSEPVRLGFLGETVFTFDALVDSSFDLVIQPGSSGIISLGGYVGVANDMNPHTQELYFDEESSSLTLYVPQHLAFSLVVHYY